MRYAKLSLRERLRRAEGLAAQFQQQSARANYIVVALLTQMGGSIVLTQDATLTVDAEIKAANGKVGWTYAPQEGGGGTIQLKTKDEL